MAYLPGCESEIIAYNCDLCPEKEMGKIRNIAFVNVRYYATLLADIETKATWEAGVNEDLDVILIPQINGEMPEPSPKVIPGYGDVLERFIAYDFVLNIFDGRYKENCEFYNLIKESQRYHIAYFTETQGHISPIPVTILPRPIIQNDLGTQVEIKTEIKWRHKNFPCPFDAPAGLFTECYIPD
jgi:hypothetical protein